MEISRKPSLERPGRRPLSHSIWLNSEKTTSGIFCISCPSSHFYFQKLKDTLLFQSSQGSFSALRWLGCIFHDAVALRPIGAPSWHISSAGRGDTLRPLWTTWGSTSSSLFTLYLSWVSCFTTLTIAAVTLPAWEDVLLDYIEAAYRLSACLAK